MKIYLVGGAVRDSLLKLAHAETERDWVVVGSSPEEMVKLGYMPVGKDFPVFLHPVTHEEYALARTERKSGRGYKGFVFNAAPEISLEEDLKRRDLTVNAMAMTPEGKIIDPYHGQKDLDQKILRHVSDAFVEDPVRILRTARLMARFGHLGFTIASETELLLKNMVKQGEVDALVPDRVWQEMQKALSEKSPEIFFKILSACGALEKLFPEIQKFTIAHSVLDTKLNFAQLFLNLTYQQIISFCKRYPVPLSYRELSLIANKFQAYFFKQDKLTPQEILEIFEKSDSFRRKDRLENLFKIFESSQHIDLLKKALGLMKSIHPQKFIQEGLSGAKLGERIKQERLKILEKI